MASSIDYFSFPPFNRRRQSTLSKTPRRIWPQLTKTVRRLPSIKEYLQFGVPLTMAQETKTTRGLPRPMLALSRNLDNNTSSDTQSTAEACDHKITHQSTTSHTSDSVTATSSNHPELSSTTTTPTSSSVNSATSQLQARIKHRIHDLVRWRKEDSNVEARPEISWPSAPTHASDSSSDESLIADLDALALPQAELELLRRMENVCHDARAARVKRQEGVSTPDGRSDLRLRGGGGDGGVEAQPFKGPRRRTTLPPTSQYTPRADPERPNSVVWWLAGGRRSRGGQVPTVGELRVRKEVEQANRRIVGFWGTVIGLRRVGRVGLLDDGGDAGGEEGLGDMGIEAVASGSTASVKGASVHAGSTRSVGSGVVEAVGGALDDGDKTGAIASSDGSAEDQSIHGKSTKSVEEREAAQGNSTNDAGEKTVESDGIAEESSSVQSLEESNHQDEHQRETEAKEAAEATEDARAQAPSGAKSTHG